MWIADGWQDYELLSCGGGEKLEHRLWTEELLPRLPQAEKVKDYSAGDATEPVFKIWKSITTD